MKIHSVVALSVLLVSDAMFAQTAAQNIPDVIPAEAPTVPGVSPNSAETMQANSRRQVAANSTTDRVPKYSDAQGALTDSIILDTGELSILGHMNLIGNPNVGGPGYGAPRFFMVYPTGNGYGADVTGMMNTTHTLSFGFNSQGSFSCDGGLTTCVAAIEGRTLYFFDRVASKYRGALDGAGAWWFGSSPTNFGLRVNAPSGTVTGMTIGSSGKVYIGTNTEPTAPATKLHVEGDLSVSGDITGAGVFHAVYQDVAEWVPSKSDLAPGTVVVLDPAIGNGIKASSVPYDTSVAGVVSAQPGIILGVQGESKEQIATTGRVRAKVDASSGAIAVGDLLVTSDNPGYAMRSTPIEIGGASIHRPGTIVGKALEPLKAGEGEILVLLSLQ